MKPRDLVTICHQGINLLDESKRKFIQDIGPRIFKGLPITPAQHQYLQSCYDTVISKKYNLEEMSTDKEYDARRCIAKNIKQRL